MRPKIIFTSLVSLMAFLAFSLYAPVFYNYWQETNGLLRDNMISVFFGMMIVWFVLLGATIGPILYEMNKD